jgi:D-proline reductase (dithiol) PrdB
MERIGTPPPKPPVDYLARTRARYDALGYPQYRWVENAGAPPFTPITKPLNRSRLGSIGSGGIYRAGQKAYHFKDDTSYRTIPISTPVDQLRITHFAYDLSDARTDPNIVFPLAPLREMAVDGEIGELAPEAFSFVGGIYSARRCRDELAPKLVHELLRQECDLALLVPV